MEMIEMNGKPLKMAEVDTGSKDILKEIGDNIPKKVDSAAIATKANSLVQEGIIPAVGLNFDKGGYQENQRAFGPKLSPRNPSTQPESALPAQPKDH